MSDRNDLNSTVRRLVPVTRSFRASIGTGTCTGVVTGVSVVDVVFEFRYVIAIAATVPETGGRRLAEALVVAVAVGRMALVSCRLEIVVVLGE